MSGLAPRAPADSVRPRGLSAVVVRPLTFTVRRMYPPGVDFESAFRQRPLLAGRRDAAFECRQQ